MRQALIYEAVINYIIMTEVVISSCKVTIISLNS